MNGREIFNAIKTMIIGLLGDYALVGDWIAIPGTLTYASATIATSSTDLSSYLSVGDKVKYTNTTAKYGYITAISTTEGISTLTINGGSDYVLESAAISGAYFSRDSSPRGFPQWFNWTPTLTGFSANPASAVYKFCVIGRKCMVFVRMLNDGTSNANTFLITAPITPANDGNIAAGLAVDNGSGKTTACRVQIDAGNSRFALFTDMYTGAWTTSNGKRADFQAAYPI